MSSHPPPNARPRETRPPSQESTPSLTPALEPLLDLATAYQRSMTLFALIEFEVPTLLAAGPRTLEDLAAQVGADALAMDRFLNACVALGLLVREGNRFHNSPAAERHLVRGASGYLGDAFGRHDRDSYPRWNDLARRLLTWRPGATERAPVGDQDIAAMRALHALALLTGEALAARIDLSKHRAVLDLGGGTGAMSIALCERHPHLRAIVFDLPALAEVAAEFVRERELAGRIEVRSGDFTRDPLPPGSDVALLANLLSVSSPAGNRALLARIFGILPPEGIVMLSGWMLNDDESGPLVPVLFCLEDIIRGAPDVERSTATYAGWLAEAGFESIEHIPYFAPTCLMMGRKPTGTRAMA
jgi:SAM-dependent methyltransferase